MAVGWALDRLEKQKTKEKHGGLKVISRQIKTNSESQNVLAQCEETHLILEGRKKTLRIRFRMQRGGWLQERLDSQIWKPIIQSQGSDWEERGI